MKYFKSVVDFVDQYLWVVIIAVALAIVVEAVVFLILKFKSGDSFQFDGFFVAIVSNVVVVLGLYILACLCVGFVNCVKVQDWHFWTNYKQFIEDHSSLTMWVCGIALVGGTIAGTIVNMSRFDMELVWAIIVGILEAIALLLLIFLVSLILYVVIAFLIIVAKLLWFVFSGFFISMYQFIVKYWLGATIIILGPGVIYGLISALISYIVSIKEEVYYI